MSVTIGIDPGASGGIAWLDAGHIVQAEPMPEGMTAQVDFLRRLVALSPSGGMAIMEKAGSSRPGNSAKSATTFARHCGNLEAALYCLGISTTQVHPKTWQKHFGALPKEKKDRKNAIKELMARRYPHLSVTLKTADALAIWTYGTEATK